MLTKFKIFRSNLFKQIAIKWLKIFLKKIRIIDMLLCCKNFQLKCLECDFLSTYNICSRNKMKMSSTKSGTVSKMVNKIKKTKIASEELFFCTENGMNDDKESQYDNEKKCGCAPCRVELMENYYRHFYQR